MPASPTPLDAALAALAAADIPLLRLSPALPVGEGPRQVQVLVPHVFVPRATAILEPRDWRYSWSRVGLRRLLPMSDYWWDGGHELELYWGLPAAPLPGWVLNRLASQLWRLARRSPGGFMEVPSEAWLVHLAIQSCRPGLGHDEEWSYFNELARDADWTAVEDLARRARVSRAVTRARHAASKDGERPGPGAVFDGALRLPWRLATVAQSVARPRRYRRLLAGTPALGDATIRCKIAGVEVLAGRGVFVPTPDADHFVDLTLEAVRRELAPTIVEVGTGCGAIACAVAVARPDAEVHATELSDRATTWARRNVQRLRLRRTEIHRGSLVAPLPAALRGRVHCISANLPYFPKSDYAAIGSVPSDTIQGDGTDGLDLLRQLAREARSLLRPGGRMLLQMFPWQWPILSSELAALGYQPGDARPVRTGDFVICAADLATQPTEHR